MALLGSPSRGAQPDSSTASPPPASPAVKPKVIVCTIGMITDIVARVAGPRAQVKGLIGAGVDPHLFKATRTDMATLLNADAVFYNGLLLEGKLSDALVRVATSGRKVHAVTELIDEAELLSPSELGGHFDPHVWMDPKAWCLAVDVIRDRLGELIPEHAEEFKARAAEARAEITALDAYAERVLATVPVQTRVLVTAHDAFNYFGRRYGYEVVGIQGISTESEAGVRDIERLVTLLVTRKIPAVFVESTVADRNLRALIAGAKAKGHDVRIGGTLFSDAMGAPGTYEGTYIGMMDHNITAIARALGGEAPQTGMAGKLSQVPP